MFDTLRVTPVVIDAALSVSPGARSVTVAAGAASVADFATITLTGSDGWWQPWTASHKANWLGISNPTGSGSSTLNWSRNPSGLAPGVYVDTISVSVPSINASARIFDTLRISAVPVTIAVSPIAHSVVLQQGSVAPADFASVTLSGTAAPATAWSAVHRGSWLNLTSSSGTGSGTVAWTRNVAALAAGTYVDTIVVSAVGVSSAAMIYDSVRISAAPVPLHIAVAPGGRNTSVQQGQAASGDQAFITLTGTGASTTAWTASNTRAWLSLTNPAGTGSTTLVWTRNASGLNPGVYIDTISVRALGATGSPALVIDTLSITAIPVPLHIVASSASRVAAVEAGQQPPSDQVFVSITGTSSQSASWTATNHHSWLALTASSGIGNGPLAWTRASGLSAGLYVDTITVVVTGAPGATATVIDSLTVRAAAVPLVVAVGPSSHAVSITQGSAAPGDNASVVVTGDGSNVAGWSAQSSASWVTLTGASGVGSGTVRWNRSTTALAAGMHVDTITITVPGSSNGSVAVYDSVRVTALQAPAGVIAIEPKGRKSRVLRSNGFTNSVATLVDSAMVVGDADEPAGDSWVATASSARLQMLRPVGSINTSVIWQRVSSSPAEGLDVDTVVVVLQRDASVQTQFIDSLQVVDVAAPDPQSAVSQLFGGTSLTDDQRVLLDQLGNHNGRYDLGDFLAWVQRAGIKLTSAMSAQLRVLGAPSGAPKAKH